MRHRNTPPGAGASIDLDSRVCCLVIRGPGLVALGNRYSTHHSCATRASQLFLAYNMAFQKTHLRAVYVTTQLNEQGYREASLWAVLKKERNKSHVGALPYVAKNVLELHSVTC